MRERLAHDGAFDVHVELGEEEVGGERLVHGAVACTLEHERVWLVLPLDPVLVEDARELPLDRVGEPGYLAHTTLHAPAARHVNARRVRSGEAPYAPSVTSYELEVHETDLDKAALAEITGELDLTNADELERRLDEVAAGSAALVLDLNRVEFLDSAALHVLFGVARRSTAKGRGFGVVLASEAAVARTLSIVNFGEVAPVRPTLEDVLAALEAS